MNDWTPYSVRIRAWIRGLFASRYSMQLEADLAEAKRERDYFKGRAERLELMLMPNRNPIVAADKPVLHPARRTWAQVQEDHARQMAEAQSEKKEN